jgi:hypothetical protein
MGGEKRVDLDCLIGEAWTWAWAWDCLIEGGEFLLRLLVQLPASRGVQ